VDVARIVTGAKFAQAVKVTPAARALHLPPALLGALPGNQVIGHGHEGGVDQQAHRRFDVA